MSDSDTISTLNDLLVLTRDGAADFDASAELANNLKIKELLHTAAERCRSGATELASKVQSLGGEPDDGQSIRGSLHVAWTELKSKVSGMSDTELLDEIVKDEEAARSTYETALAKPLPADVKSLIEKQYVGVQQHYELVRGLRSSFVYGHSRS